MEIEDESNEAWETIDAADLPSKELYSLVDKSRKKNNVVEAANNSDKKLDVVSEDEGGEDDIDRADDDEDDGRVADDNDRNKRAGEDNEEHTNWLLDAITLFMFTSFVVAIPFVMNQRGFLNLLSELSQPESPILQVLTKSPFVKEVNDSNRHDNQGTSLWDNQSENAWSSPLNDKDFVNSIVGGGGSGSSRAQEKSPFDFFDGPVWNDAKQQDFMRGAGMFFKRKNVDQSEQSLEQMITDLLAQKVESTTKREQESFVKMIHLLKESGQEVMNQVNRTFGSVGLERFNLLQFLYYMEDNEARRNAVWKRKMHRFQPELPYEAAIQLFDGLYLSQLAYAPTCEEIYNRLQVFRGGLFSLRNCTVEASVNRPAHFLAVRKLGTRANQKDNFLANFDLDADKDFRQRFARSWLSKALKYVRPHRQKIEVIVVIRGTKEVFDFLTDAHLEAADFQGGKAHDGILRSAKWLESLYEADLKRFAQQIRARKGKKMMKIRFLGHSLGGGTAALAAMLFRERKEYAKWVDAEAIGYGTPSLVSPDLSYKYQDVVTTVVNDADVVPRTSGSALVRSFLQIIRYNWSDAVLEDYDQLVSTLTQDQNIMKHFFGNAKSKAWLQKTSSDVREWLKRWFDENVGPYLEELPSGSENEDEVELIPPGECIHFYRDGVAYQGNYVNCSFFGKEIEVVRHFVDDHLIPPGYYPALLGFVRGRLQNLSWTFDDDISLIDY